MPYLPAARQFFARTSAPSGPTARNYVQNGLVAMWDGIENVGWGTHDSTATGWTNLVTGEVSNFVNAIGGFGANRYESGDGGGVAIGTAEGICTLEILLARFGGVYAITTPADEAAQNASGAMNLIFVDGVGYVPNKANAGSRIVFADYTQPHAVALTRQSASDTSVTTYGDGAPSTGALYNDFWTVTRGYIAYSSYYNRWSNIHCYCHRLYNRALTAAEIAANYAIDRQRFNLA